MQDFLNDYRWLTSDAASVWLREAAAAETVSTTLAKRLRKQLSERQTQLVLEQTELRRRARVKFSNAEQMFFTRVRLEQATDEAIARHKSLRFSAAEVLADFCSGIGGDLVALAQRHTVTGIDLDPIAVILATANCRANYVARAKVVRADAADFDVQSVDGWHIDPDRRPDSNRVVDLECVRPGRDQLEALLASNPNGAIKLAPATKVPAEWASAAQLEWIGSRNECRQQVAWFGRFAMSPGTRSATIVSTEGSHTFAGVPTSRGQISNRVQHFIYEPTSTLLAAGLEHSAAAELGVCAVARGVAYFTSDRQINDPMWACFEVRDVMAFDQRRLKAYCRENGLGRIEVKKRGVDIAPNRLAKQLAKCGDGHATMLICRIGDQVRAIVAHRFGKPSNGGPRETSRRSPW